MHSALDWPRVEEPSDPLNLRVEGWVFVEGRQAAITSVEVGVGGRVIGRTTLLFKRPDVSAALAIPPETETGFALRLHAPDLVGQSHADLTVFATFADGATESIAARRVPLIQRDYRKGDWGILVDPAFPHLVRREHMYNSGPSQDCPSGELLSLLDRYLPPGPARVLDVGCGRGPYAAPLRERGYDWFGVEVKAEDCAVLAAKGLPHQHVDGLQLPFGNGEFEAAIAIEVLEHIVDPWSFLAEVRRVIRNRLIISVPNAEVVTYWRSHLAVPWHLLEADHRSFFSRASLAGILRPHFRSVEVLSYGELSLRAADRVAVDYHLLAIADV